MVSRKIEILHSEYCPCPDCTQFGTKWIGYPPPGGILLHDVVEVDNATTNLRTVRAQHKYYLISGYILSTPVAANVSGLVRLEYDRGGDGVFNILARSRVAAPVGWTGGGGHSAVFLPPRPLRLEGGSIIRGVSTAASVNGNVGIWGWEE